jgi:N-acetyl-anhydromuramyl-L-alanine amidase AmpD
MVAYKMNNDLRELLEERGTEMNGTNSVRFIVVHCSATSPSQDYTVEALERDHLKRGFRTIGYHFYIRRDGTLTRHRKLLEVGAHCKPINRCSIGVCYEGGLDENSQPADTRTPEQKERLLDLLRNLKQLFPQAMIISHRDVQGAKKCDCPSFDATKEYSDIVGD